MGCWFGRWVGSWVVEGWVGECLAGWLGSCSLFLVLVMMHRDHFFNCTTRCSFGFSTPAAERRSHGCKKPPHPFSLFSEARTLFFNLNFVSHWSMTKLRLKNTARTKRPANRNTRNTRHREAETHSRHTRAQHNNQPTTAEHRICESHMNETSLIQTNTLPIMLSGR